METGFSTQNQGFTHMIKRIWNGPEDEEDSAKVKNMDMQEHSYDMRGINEDRLENGNRPFRRDYPQQKQIPQQDMRNFETSSVNATIISKGTVINGNIKSDGDIEMYGSVSGSIETTGRVKINGKQIGDVQGSSVDLMDCTVRGNISASDSIVVDSNSVIVGDIKGGSLTFDGKLKGNVHVMGNVNLQGNAVIIGDVTSTTITVESGARLQGSIQVSDGSIDDVDLPDDLPDTNN
ncbi:MAG: Polymer-forming cytoskeletal protein [Thermocaproicibacter melissae]|jgi:cytoskeletal protein CcmA (bactofilin family)|uniref:bactofilin family protein n=1 Tax=Thermocaproicibacter melissae TaxID=2966552 RepID=UPI003A0FCC77